MDVRKIFASLLGRVEHFALLRGHFDADVFVPVERLWFESAETDWTRQKDEGTGRMSGRIFHSHRRCRSRCRC